MHYKNAAIGTKQLFQSPQHEANKKRSLTLQKSLAYIYIA